ncbi:MAG: hypothetical protein IIA02_01205 [Proteobacteria bacterium]|nr:hypothetical protein [Pseudomonadota bacterium]
MRPHRHARVVGLLAWLGIAVALLAVFLWYLSPHLVVEMAGRLWSCI